MSTDTEPLLETMLAGHAIVFAPKSDDHCFDDDVIVARSDFNADTGEVELYFAVTNPPRTIYLRMRIDDVKRLLDEKQP